MKILCCSAGGNWRSQHLAQLFKDVYHQDALACGIATSQGNDTLEMLYNWADVIIVLDKDLADNVLEYWHNKLLVWDVGADEFEHTVSPDLMRKLISYIDKENGKFGEEKIDWVMKWRAGIM